MQLEFYNPLMARASVQRAVHWYLREWRKHLGMTQQDIADSIETSISMVSDQEAGKKRMNDDWIAGWADALGIEPIDLLRPPPPKDPDHPERTRRLSQAMRIFQALPDERQERFLGILIDVAPDEEASEPSPAPMGLVSPKP